MLRIHRTKLIHSIVVTPANVHGSQVLEDLIHGNETRVWGDPAYAGQYKLLEVDCIGKPRKPLLRTLIILIRLLRPSAGPLLTSKTTAFNISHR